MTTDIDGGGAYPALTPRFKALPRAHRRVWRYWFSRVSMVLEREGPTVNALRMFGKFGTDEAAAASAANGGRRARATGLYDAGTRARFERLCEKVGAPRDPPVAGRRR